MSLSIAERQALVSNIEKANTKNKALVSDRFVISKNLNRLFLEGICTNPKQFDIIQSLVEFNARAGNLTDRQLSLASSIILQNAQFFNTVSEKEVSDDEQLPI